MKKTFFFFTMLASIAASATVTITPLNVDYANKKVTFKVAWTGTAANNRVWIWIDFCPVVGASPSTFAKANISAATATVGSIDVTSLNGRGFFVTANPSTITATLSNASGKFNWCAYGSDYPPNIASVNNGTYTLKGTQSFILNGTITISGNKYSGNINSLTDPTGCPGCIAIRDFQFSSSSVSIPCCPNLTAIGGYCRDLTADGASTYTGCGIEIKQTNQGQLTSFQGEDYLCPAGWRYPNDTEGQCMCTNAEAVNWINNGPWKREIILKGSNSSNPRYVSCPLMELECVCSVLQNNQWNAWVIKSGYVFVRCVR